jgi:hypothetical protein
MMASQAPAGPSQVELPFTRAREAKAMLARVTTKASAVFLCSTLTITMEGRGEIREKDVVMSDRDSLCILCIIYITTITTTTTTTTSTDEDDVDDNDDNDYNDYNVDDYVVDNDNDDDDNGEDDGEDGWPHQMMASQAPDWPYRAAYPLVRVSDMKLMTSQPALATNALLGWACRITW